MMRMPLLAIGVARLIAVWPPNWQMTPSGFSLSMISSTSCSVSGSKYRESEVSKSVETVSGLLLMTMDFLPALRSAQDAWTEQ